MTLTRRPRIGFNMWPFTTTRCGGMVYYALSLFKEFTHMIPERLIVFYGSHGEELLKTTEEFSLVKNVRLNHPSDLYDYRPNFDVLFTPSIWSGANMLDYPTVHVVPDIQEKFYPHFFSDSELEHRYIHHPWAARASTLLITISQYSKNTMIENFGVPEEQIRVTYLGAHPIFSDESNLGIRPRALPQSCRDYLFYPAHAWNHKNHKKLLDALYDLRSLHRLEIDLVLTGHLLDGDFNRVDILGEIRARGLQNSVFHLGTVSLSELKYLYLNARALVHTSLFEGFGIPLVEAMSCGCPVIAAYRTSMPEISRDAALYFDPEDPSDIAEKIKYLMANPSESRQRTTIGKRLAQEFSDRKTAEETLAILEDAHNLASIEGLKAAAMTRECCSPRPLFTAVFFIVDTFCRDVVGEIAKLMLEFKRELQVIAIIPRDFKYELGKILNARVETVRFEGNLAAAIRAAAHRARGKYVFFSDGHSVILPAFLHYLMAYDGKPQTSADMLYGDSYFKDTSERKIRDAGVPGLQNENTKPYCCSNLSFVVRTEAFREAQTKGLAKCETLPEFASELWNLCSRKRVYKVVNILFVDPVSEVAVALERISRRFPVEGYAGRWLRTRTMRFILCSVLPLYFKLPARLRLLIVGMLRRLVVQFVNTVPKGSKR